MADIPGNIDKLNDIEIAGDAPHSEALMNKIGANINALIDAKDVQVFPASGNYQVPENITTVLLFGAGGGGGGAGGVSPGAGAFGGGGGGGGGAQPKTIIVTGLTPLSNITVTRGAGGAGGAAGFDGSNGGQTIFGTHARFDGGEAGLFPTLVDGGFGNYPGGLGGGKNYSPLIDNVYGGNGGVGVLSGGGGSVTVGLPGLRSIFTTSGAAGGAQLFGAGGGGGGSGFRIGGAGGNGSTAAFIPGSNGATAVNNSSAGGGGGGGGAFSAGGAGGTGGTGYLIVIALS